MLDNNKMLNSDLLVLNVKNQKPKNRIKEKNTKSLQIYNYMIFQGNHGENIGQALSKKGNFLEVFLFRYFLVKKKILILQTLFGNLPHFQAKYFYPVLLNL